MADKSSKGGAPVKPAPATPDPAALEAVRIAAQEATERERAAAQARAEAEGAAVAERQRAEREAAMQAAEDAARIAAEKDAEVARLQAEEVRRQQEKTATVARMREGKALLWAPEGVTGASVGGVDYQVDDEGILAVAPEHVAELLEHRFEPAE